MKNNQVSDSTTIPLVQFYKIERKISKTTFDPHMSPPDFDAAKKHGLAARICAQDQYHSMDVCPCCGLAINNQQIPLDGDLKMLSHLGVTFPLYFQFIKKCAILFVVQLLLSSFYNICINENGDQCMEEAGIICKSSVVNILTKQGFEMQFESIANFLTIFVLIILIELFRVHQEISRYEIEKEHKVTPADFTLQISGLSQETSIEEVKQYLESQTTENIEVCQIFCLLDMEQYSILYEKKLSLISQLNEVAAKQRKHISKNYDKQVFKLEETLNAVNDKLANYEKQMQKATFTEEITQDQEEEKQPSSIISQGDFLETQYSGRLLITLNNSLQCKYFVKKFKQSKSESFWYWCYRRNIFKQFCLERLKRFEYQGRILRIKRAAEPSDINWMNVGSSKIHKKIVLSFLILFIFILVGASITKFKLVIKKKTSSNPLINIISSLGVSTVVALTNTLIGIIIRNFAGNETHKKQTNYFVSVGKRLSFLYFMNMVLTTVVANMLGHKTYTADQQYKSLIGMMDDFFFLFLTNTYLSSVFNYFDFVWGFRLYKRYSEEKKGMFSSLSQREANLLFEGHPVDMALRYANVVKVMFFTAAVSPLLPIGLPLSLFGLLILYWVDKYLLLRRYVSKHYMDKQLANAMMNLLPSYTLIFSSSNLFIHIMSKQGDEWSFSNLFVVFGESIYLALIGLIISIAYRYGITIGDFKRLYTYIFSIEVPQKVIIGTYQAHKAHFTTVYEQFHPAFAKYKQEDAQTKKINESLDNQLPTHRLPELFKTIRTSVQQRI